MDEVDVKLNNEKPRKKIKLLAMFSILLYCYFFFFFPPHISLFGKIILCKIQFCISPFNFYEYQKKKKR